jgi:dephospho-CoA kinase
VARARGARALTAPTVRIGLTGPIGCGKSTIASWLAELGATVVDADRLAREVVEPGEPARVAVVERFGRHLVGDDGRLDRAALGRIVFADPAALRDLEAIVHPAVRPRIEAAVTAAERAGAPAVVVEAIKLVEAGYAAKCDEVWVVLCREATQRERLRGRGFDDAEARRRIGAQTGTANRLRAAATRVLDTTGTREATRAVVERAWAEAIAAGPRVRG